MKTATVTVLISLLVVTHGLAEPREFKIDPDHFSIGFLVDHVGYAKQLGKFLEGEGHFVYDEQANELISGAVTIAADSIFTNHRRRDRHLRSNDFLHARRHDKIRFEATEYRPDDAGGGTLEGKLSLLGQTHPVQLQVTINKTGEYPFGHEAYTIGVSARTTIRRSQWGMDYGIADGLVGDEVELMFELEALRQ